MEFLTSDKNSLSLRPLSRGLIAAQIFKTLNRHELRQKFLLDSPRRERYFDNGSEDYFDAVMTEKTHPSIYINGDNQSNIVEDLIVTNSTVFQNSKQSDYSETSVHQLEKFLQLVVSEKMEIMIKGGKLFNYNLKTTISLRNQNQNPLIVIEHIPY
jgi:hypothetical protein